MPHAFAFVRRRLWSVAEAGAYLPVLDRLLASVDEPPRLPHPSMPRPEVAGEAGDRLLLVDGLFSVLAEDGVILRDLHHRLVDFRTRAADGSVVLLCRTGDEDHVGWWHRIEDGYAGRRSIVQDPPW